MEDYVHYCSGHSHRVEHGIVLGFYLRAFSICSEEFLDEEIRHIVTSFRNLGYPKGHLLNLKKNCIPENTKTTNSKKDIRYITIPNSKTAETIARHLEKRDVKIAFTADKMTSEMLAKKGKVMIDNSVVHKIPCGTCHR